MDSRMKTSRGRPPPLCAAEKFNGYISKDIGTPRADSLSLFWIALSGPFQSQLDRLKTIDQPRYSSCHGINLTTVSGDCFIGYLYYTAKLFSVHLLSQFSADLCIAPSR
jgi:hypothetical protein